MKIDESIHYTTNASRGALSKQASFQISVRKLSKSPNLCLQKDFP